MRVESLNSLNSMEDINDIFDYTINVSVILENGEIKS